MNIAAGLKSAFYPQGIFYQIRSQRENTLPVSSFYRPARNIIVHIKSIEKASKYFNSRLKLYLRPNPDFDVIISRVKVKNFLNWMGRDHSLREDKAS